MPGETLVLVTTGPSGAQLDGTVSVWDAAPDVHPAQH
jgi:hypothetical protein